MGDMKRLILVTVVVVGVCVGVFLGTRDTVDNTTIIKVQALAEPLR